MTQRTGNVDSTYINTVVPEGVPTHGRAPGVTPGMNGDLASRVRPSTPHEESIAVIGLGCRFPRSESTEAFWRSLCDGVDAISEVSRWSVQDFYDKDPKVPGKANTRWGGFLEQVDQFDAPFFGISPREAAQMDPQQRLAMEVAWEALADAGLPPATLAGSRTGVFFGFWRDDYSTLLAQQSPTVITQHTAVGLDTSIIAGRISYALGAHGPSLVINTACSSSLVAVHLACQSLQRGESSLALAGGVNLLLAPESTVAMSKFGGLSPDGRCFTFDARANGYVRGEGAGVVVLKPLRKAIEDGDPIYCVIRASGMNNNGAGSSGLIATSRRAQATLLREVYQRAGVPPSSVHYVEAHGTGTALGDPKEVGALADVLGAGRDASRPLRIGSCKTNIGHLEAAAGVAGLLKVALSMRHRALPPNLNFAEENPKITWAGSNVEVQRRLEPWPYADEPARAGVSSAGFGGTNAHVVLEELRSPSADCLLPLSADSLEGLRRLAQSFQALAGAPASVEAICDAAAARLSRGPHRLALLVRSQADIQEQIGRFLRGEPGEGMVQGHVERSGPQRLTFVFSEMEGGPAAFAAQQLIALEPVFRAAFHACDVLIERHVGWSLLAKLEQGEAALGASYVKPLLAFAFQVAVATLLRSWGVTPDAAVGRGASEVAANHVIGALSLEQAILAVCHKDQLALAAEERGARVSLERATHDAYFMDSIARQGEGVFLAMGLQPAARDALEQDLAALGQRGRVLPASGKGADARRAMLEVLGALYAAGRPVAWHRLYPGLAGPLPLADEVMAARGGDEDTETDPLLFPLSAHTDSALRELARKVADHVETRKDLPLCDLSYTASVRRGHLPHRLAALVRTRAELVEGLTAFARGETAPGLSEGRVAHVPGVVFVFPGQGSQWFGMGRELLAREPVFRSAMEQCEAAMRPFVSFSLLEQLTGESEAWLERIDIVQPALFAIGVSLARLWRSYGVEPSAVIGHSMGEIAAAHIAGALRLEDAARIICRRSQLMRRIRGQGAMAVVELSAPDAERALAPYGGRLCVAVSNGPRTTVVAGDPDDLKQLLGTLEAQQVFCRLLKVDMASHSPQVDPLLGELVEALQGIRPEASSVSIVSTVIGDRIDGQHLDAAYWARNLRQPVRFFDAVERLAREGSFVFVEMSPHPGLLQPIEEGLRHIGCAGSTAPSLRRQEPEVATLRGSLGALYALGCPVRWEALYPTGGRCVSLPAYAFQRERLWFDEQARRAVPSGAMATGDAPVPLLSGTHMELQSPSGAHAFQVELGLSRFPYLNDHRVGQRAVLPAAAFLAMALAGARSTLGEGSPVLERVRFSKALFLPEEGAQTAQLIVEPEAAGQASFRVASLEAAAAATSSAWTLHVEGSARLLRAEEGATGVEPIAAIQARCGEAASGEEHYRAMRERDLHYGPLFQGIEQVTPREGEALARLRWTLPQEEVEAYEVHPALLDASLQALLAALPGASEARGTYLPASVARMRVRERITPGEALWAHAVVRSSDGAQSFTGDVFLRGEHGRVLVEVEGLTLQRLEHARAEGPADWLYAVHWRPQSRSTGPALPRSQRGRWLILADKGGVGGALAARLEAQGEACVLAFAGAETSERSAARHILAPNDKHAIAALLGEARTGGDPFRGVVHLWSLNVAPTAAMTLEALDEAQALGCGSALCLVQALTEAGGQDHGALFLVTRGAQAVLADEAITIAQAPLVGFARTLAGEHPELAATRIDLDLLGAPEDDGAALFQEIVGAPAKDLVSREEEIALRGGKRYVARLGRAALPAEPAEPTSPAQPSPGAKQPAGEETFHAEVTTPGVLSALALVATRRRAPGRGQLEIAVDTVGLNFRDVLKVLGLYPGLPPGPIPLGDEVSGRVVAVGEGISSFAVGDDVVALTDGFGLGTHALADEALVVHRPATLDPAAAATLPVAFLTAYYALHHVGRMERGERVLIHSAAGGVGLAAVELAQRAGAEVFATAGTEEKRALLRSLGIAHVMDSHSLEFAEEIMARTSGEGVDLVLNALAGAFLPRSLELLRENGRFLEIGKRDVYQNSRIGLRPLASNVSFSVIDLELAWRRRPALVGAMLRTLMEKFAQGELTRPPVQVYPVTALSDAFHALAQSAHIGKIAVSLEARATTPIERPLASSARLDPGGTYLITGGLGGLGLAVAGWMVEQGARSLVLVGRRAASADAELALRALERAGARVLAAQADVADEAQVQRLFARIDQELPPLRGVVHAAGLLDDALIARMSQERLQRVTDPKVKGAFNLYRQSRGRSLDFLVLFSSAAALLGLPGQANYAAGNAFLDALAHLGRKEGVPVLSIGWGPWSEVGLAAAQENRGERLEERGLKSLSVAQGLRALEVLFEASIGRANGPAQIGAMRFDVERWGASYPRVGASAWFAELRGAQVAPAKAAEQEGSLHGRLASARPAERRSLLEAHLRELVAKVLRLSPSRIEVDRPLHAMGLDSLMTVELKNRLEASLGLSLSATLIWSYPTLTALGPQLAGKLNLSLEEVVASPSPAKTAEGDAQLAADVARLSREDALKMLSEELDQISNDTLFTV